MEDRRKARRMGLECKLMVKRLDNGMDEEVNIYIQDVSKTGVGFLSDAPLEMNAIYESYITLWTKEVIHTVLQIARITPTDTGYLYGAIFMGLSDADAFRISVYDALEQYQQEHNENTK